MNVKIGAGLVKNNEMKAVHDNDLMQLLKSLGVYNNVMAGKYKCLFCGKTITIENIDSIVPHEGTIQFTCDCPQCHTNLLGLNK